MLHPHEINATKLRATLAKLIEQNPDPSSSEHIALVKLINEFSVLGFPIFVEAVEDLFNTDDFVAEYLWKSPALVAVIERTWSGVQSDGPRVEQVYGIAEEEHLLRQLKELIEETNLLHAFKDLSDIERLRSSLWIIVTPWLLKKAHDERNQRLRRLLINASDQMGVSLSVSAELYEEECFDILSGVLRACYLAGGELDLSGLSDQTFYLLDDLRGLDQIETLSLSNKGVSYLIKKRILGFDRVQGIEIKELREEHLDLVARHTDHEYVQSVLHKLVVGAESKKEHGLECPAEILDKISASQYKDELLFVAKRFSYPEQISYELDKVSFNLNYIPHPDQGYWMMETQVTQALYWTVTGESPSRFNGDQLPVERVSWAEGIAFCNTLSMIVGITPAYKGTDNHCELISGANGFRLPFEAEWAFAAKAGQQFIYSGSDNIDAVAWHTKNSDGKTHKVAKKKSNGYGIYDMSGNVWEWCADDYYNPGSHRIGAFGRACRGGSFDYYAYECKISSRRRTSVDIRDRYLGLRLCRSLG